MLLSFFQYGFAWRALEAGVVIALVAPLVGIFLVLRRYSLVADTLAHVSLAGIALGLFLGLNPFFVALVVSIFASLGLEKLRVSKRVSGESALALFLSASLALATILLGLARGFNVNLANYLFGSIMTVTQGDVYVVIGLAAAVLVLVWAFYKEFFSLSFDLEFAQASGLPVRFVNALLMVLAALVVSLTIPIAGVLLVSALVVIPVFASLQLRKSFGLTLLYAELFSVFSVVFGLLLSFCLNIASSGAIVLTMLCFFALASLFRRR